MERELLQSLEDVPGGVYRDVAHADERAEQSRAQPRTLLEEGGAQHYAAALERVLEASACSNSANELVANLLELLAGVAHADIGLALLREGNTLVARASIGNAPAHWQASADGAPQLSLSPSAAFEGRVPRSGEVFPLREPVKILEEQRRECLLCVPLQHDSELLGALYLGTFGDWQPQAEQTRLLALLAPSCAAALKKQAAYDALQRDVRTRDDVLGVVAHDLQNPLNVISMAANMLLQRVPEQSARRPIERIVRSVQRATRLLRDLLDVRAIEEGHFAVDRRRLDPTALILSALESQQSLAADASVITATDLSPSLPTIDADEERLLEVLENLIGNAIKFTNPGGTITVGACCEGSEIKIWVADNGSGIPAPQLPHIFDRFWQAKRADRRGTGLGLTICKGIVEAHQGRNWAESSLGKGTTLSFTLPAVDAPDSRSQATNVANILLVDDRPENLMALETILERPDYRLVKADSGEKALRLALREQFAVALIDIAMPVMNGLEVATHLKELERSRDIPIIFVTAFGDDPEEIHRAYAAGGADYLVKPLDAEIVKKKVAVFVDLSRRRGPSDRPLLETAPRG
jgi:signal transduction histidine kinase/ActR/RegA family two-component response regulator